MKTEVSDGRDDLFLQIQVIISSLSMMFIGYVVQQNYAASDLLFGQQLHFPKAFYSLLFVCPFFFVAQLVLPKIIKPSFRLEKANFAVATISIIFLLYYFFYQTDLKLFYFWNPEKTATYMSERMHWILFIFIWSTFYIHFKPVSDSIKSKIKFLSVSIMVMISLYIARLGIFNDYHYYNENTTNFQVVLHSVVQTVFGKELLVNLNSQYGLYAVFLHPIFLIFGLSILKFTIVMSLIYAASFLAIGFFLFQAVENPVVALIGFCAYLYFNYFVASIWPYELYFQYTPIRTIFPALSIFLFYRYLLRPSSLKKFLLLATMATSIFWNPETGVFVYFALACGLAFSQLINSRPLQRRLMDAGKEFLQSGAVLVLIFLLFKVYMRLVFGEWPDLGNLFLATHQYTSSDIRLLADSASIYIFLIYLISLCLSIRAVVAGRGDRGDITAFFLTVLGMGLITYFMHNGHYSTLGQTGYPAILLLTLFTERLIKSIRTADLLDRSARWIQWTRLSFAVTSLFVISFFGASYFAIWAYAPQIKEHVNIEQVFFNHVGKRDKICWNTSKGAVTLADLPTGVKPPWILRAEAVARRFSKPDGAIVDDVFVYSMWDAYIYLILRGRTPLDIINTHHTGVTDWWAIPKALESRVPRIVVFDTSHYVASTFANQPRIFVLDQPSILKEIEAALKKDYHMIGEDQMPDGYYDGWNPESLIYYERNPN